MQKTKEQENEINNISWAARILYDILAPSAVSIEYLCILAVLMSQRNDKKFLSSKMTLQNGQQIDLLMKDGIIIFKSKITNSMKKDCSRSIQQKDTSVPTILNFPNAQWEKTIQNSSSTEGHDLKEYQHWISRQFSCFMKHINLRAYLLNKWYQNNYSFMQKTKEQNNISWAARILYDILAPSSVSIEYLYILAVLRSQRNDIKFLSSKITLQNGHQGDLSMKETTIHNGHQIDLLMETNNHFQK